MPLRSPFVGLDCDPAETQCLLCSASFIIPTNEEDYMDHLWYEHHIVIADVCEVASLRSYLNYWRVRFQGSHPTKFCAVLKSRKTKQQRMSSDEVYYLLSDALPEDKTLRDEIKRARLELFIAQQEFERQDTTFKRDCIFCRTTISGLRSDYVTHLSRKHNFKMGNPHDLVYVDELFDILHEHVENLTCIYCEKVFKDRTVLKEHMRKKLHKRINPAVKYYNKFYMQSCLKPQIEWRTDTLFRGRLQSGLSDEDDEYELSWEDWLGKDEPVMCLLCPYKNEEFDAVLEHMKQEHRFDFDNATRSLNFYAKIKVVNYIRRQTFEKRCILCNEQFEDVCEHIKTEDHGYIPRSSVWDRPEFYFPLYESESFIYRLDCPSDDEDDERLSAGVVHKAMYSNREELQ